MIKKQKNELRKEIRNIRKSIKDKHKKDSKIHKQLESLKEFKKANKVLIYHSIDEEVSTIEITNKYLDKKFIILPRTEKKELKLHHIAKHQHIEKGKFNICEPKLDRPVVDPSTVELAIIPGVAFDKNRYRMGFGKGFYDRLLKNIKAPKIALAYEEQIVKYVPREEHDEKVDVIVTDKRIIR